ncbi:hypothetical protein KQ945_15655 [Bacillus subtilis subsp. subtilis]|nr:hypothetical protein [Bacillus subtilis subsp. subtilis]
MDFERVAALVALGLFAAILLAAEVGRRLGLARLRRDPDDPTKGAAAAEAAVFGLLGLLIAFTFSGAASRFEDRRHLITAEANAIGTAYLRVDLLGADAQGPLRDLFRQYVAVRAKAYQDVADPVLSQQRQTAATRLQQQLWTGAVTASRQPDAAPQAPMLLLPALNDMIDITTTRATAARNHPPAVIFLLLGGLSVIGALLVGYGTAVQRQRSWLHTVMFGAILALTVYVIVDLEFPRLGFIRVDAADQVLVELGESMH